MEHLNMENENVKIIIQELRRHGLSNGGSLGYHSGMMDAAADLIEELVTELRELKKLHPRGTWKHDPDHSDLGHDTYTCSICGENITVYEECDKPSFCPNCGAKINKE